MVTASRQPRRPQRTRAAAPMPRPLPHPHVDGSPICSPALRAWAGGGARPAAQETRPPRVPPRGLQPLEERGGVSASSLRPARSPGAPLPREPASPLSAVFFQHLHTPSLHGPGPRRLPEAGAQPLGGWPWETHTLRGRSHRADRPGRRFCEAVCPLSCPASPPTRERRQEPRDLGFKGNWESRWPRRSASPAP